MLSPLLSFVDPEGFRDSFAVLPQLLRNGSLLRSSSPLLLAFSLSLRCVLFRMVEKVPMLSSSLIPSFMFPRDEVKDDGAAPLALLSVVLLRRELLLEPLPIS